MIEVLCDECLDEVLANPQEYVEQGALKPLVRITTEAGPQVEVSLGAEDVHLGAKTMAPELHYFIEVRPIEAPQNIWQTAWDFDYPHNTLGEIFNYVVKNWNN